MADQVVPVDPAVAHLVDRLVEAGAHIHWPDRYQGWFGLRGAAGRRIAVYVRSHWASVLLTAEAAEAAVASGRGFVERQTPSTSYVRFTNDALSSPDGAAEGLRFALAALELGQSPNAGTPQPEEAALGAQVADLPDRPGPTDAPGSGASGVLGSARAAWSELGQSPDLTIEPVGGAGWLWARLGMGPFPARLVLDERAEVQQVEVIVGFASQTYNVEATAASIPLPTPQIRYELAPESIVQLRYTSPLASTARDAYGLLSMAVQYATMFAWALYTDLTESTQRLLGERGLDPQRGWPPATSLLSAGAWRYEPWERERAPGPSTEPERLDTPMPPVDHSLAARSDDHLTRLALSVARCPQVESARLDARHPCSEIVGPCSQQIPGDGRCRNRGQGTC